MALRGPIEGDDKPCTSNFFRNTKGKSFDYGIGKDISRFKEKYDIIIGLKQYEVNVQMEGAPSNTSTARPKKEQFMLVDNLVFSILTVKYPFVNETPTLKDIDKEILMVKTECDSVTNMEYRLWQNLANYTSIIKSILDRWIYCNQEEIARRALAMYRDGPSDANIKSLIDEYKLYKITPEKMADLWKPPSVRMKRHTSAGKVPNSKLADTEVFKEEFEGDPALSNLLQHIENQDWPI